MKKILPVILLVPILILLWGCPYKSEIPLDDAKEKIQKDLIGEFVVESQLNTAHPSYYRLAVLDSLHYDVQNFEYNVNDSTYEVKSFTGHTTLLGTHLFMNLQEQGKKDYLLYRIQFRGNGFTLYEVSENIDEQFTDASKMREFFEQYKNLSFFYNKDEVLLVRRPE